MSSRDRGASTGSGVAAVLEAVLARVVRVERAVRDLQSQRGQSLPAGWRFGTNSDGELVVRRVSTGETHILTAAPAPGDDV